eukprot:CAMPEP_0170509632 /NCGR_PEP_ID=MMETSP0208-20121228/65324_1 /TAXON_ID=197538 /ORGANISM="Strombidium inclinatum, Strain S3" /LENGTH=40 /DNA_ID= /DNA_START= /DNA_END= /DNA_ORIENTATION=
MKKKVHVIRAASESKNFMKARAIGALLELKKMEKAITKQN